MSSTNLASYCYDNNGNLTSKTVGTATTQYSWDFENRLIQVTLPGGPTVNYEYDALGRRIMRSTSNGAVQKFVYDGQDVIQDLDDSGQVVTSYLNGPGIDNKIRQTDANGNLYYVANQLGSTIALTDDSGTMVEGIGYDSFGNSTGSSLTRYTYTGREFDSDTGLYYYRARWYDPQVGRFISEDPIALGGGINLFVYVKNEPISLVDPWGTFPVAGVAIAAAITGEWGIHYYLMNRSHGLFPDVDQFARKVDPLGRKKHCYVNCMSVRIHLGGREMATDFSIVQEIPTLIDGAVNGHFRREIRDTTGDLAANGYGQFMAYAIWRSCKEICDQCPGF